MQGKLVNPYTKMTDAELCAVIADVLESKKTGTRANSLVPYAEQIKVNIGGDFTLRESLEWAKNDLTEEVMKRFHKEHGHKYRASIETPSYDVRACGWTVNEAKRKLLLMYNAHAGRYVYDLPELEKEHKIIIEEIPMSEGVVPPNRN